MWKTLTLKRLANLTGNVLSEHISRIIKRPVVWGFPSVVSIEPSAYCNLRCPECPSGNGDLLRKRGYMSLDTFEKALQEIATQSLAIQFFFQGEPFLNPELTTMLRKASATKLYTIVSTNGHFLEEYSTQIVASGLNKLIVSFDGMTEKTYQQYRQGGDYEKVKRGIIALLEEKEKQQAKLPLIELQFIVFEHNEHEIADFKKWCKKHKVKGMLKSAQIYHLNQNTVNPPKAKRFSRYINTANKWVNKSQRSNSCRRLWTNPVICWDGSVAICCYDKDTQFKVGNINNSQLADIWHNTTFQKIRTNILNGKNTAHICCNCAK